MKINIIVHLNYSRLKIIVTVMNFKTHLIRVSIVEMRIGIRMMRSMGGAPTHTGKYISIAGQ